MFNNTTIDIDDNYMQVASNLWVNVVLVVVASLVILLTICGNLTVLIAFWIKRSIRKPANYFLASLAVSDLFIGSFSMPLFAQFLYMNKWLLGSWSCDMWLTVDWAVCMTSQLTVLLITTDRFLSLKIPGRYGEWRTRRRALKVIAISWILPFGICLVSILGWPHFVPEGRTIKTHDCHIQFMDDSFFTLLWAGGCYFFPLIVMCVLYVLIYRVALRLHHSLHQPTRSSTSNTTRGLVTFSLTATVNQSPALQTLPAKKPDSSSKSPRKSDDALAPDTNAALPIEKATSDIEKADLQKATLSPILENVEARHSSNRSLFTSLSKSNELVASGKKNSAKTMRALSANSQKDVKPITSSQRKLSKSSSKSKPGESVTSGKKPSTSEMLDLTAISQIADISPKPEKVESAKSSNQTISKTKTGESVTSGKKPTDAQKSTAPTSKKADISHVANIAQKPENVESAKSSNQKIHKSPPNTRTGETVTNGKIVPKTKMQDSKATTSQKSNISLTPKNVEAATSSNQNISKSPSKTKTGESATSGKIPPKTEIQNSPATTSQKSNISQKPKNVEAAMSSNQNISKSPSKTKTGESATSGKIPPKIEVQNSTASTSQKLNISPKPENVESTTTSNRTISKSQIKSKTGESVTSGKRPTEVQQLTVPTSLKANSSNTAKENVESTTTSNRTISKSQIKPKTGETVTSGGKPQGAPKKPSSQKQLHNQPSKTNASDTNMYEKEPPVTGLSDSAKQSQKVKTSLKPEGVEPKTSTNRQPPKPSPKTKGSESTTTAKRPVTVTPDSHKTSQNANPSENAESKRMSKPPSKTVNSKDERNSETPTTSGIRDSLKTLQKSISTKALEAKRKLSKSSSKSAEVKTSDKQSAATEDKDAPTNSKKANRRAKPVSFRSKTSIIHSFFTLSPTSKRRAKESVNDPTTSDVAATSDIVVSVENVTPATKRRRLWHRTRCSSLEQCGFTCEDCAKLRPPSGEVNAESSFLPGERVRNTATKVYRNLSEAAQMHTCIVLHRRRDSDPRTYHTQKALRTISMIVGAYLICWTPFYVMAVAMAIGGHGAVNDTLYIFTYWLRYINSPINPFIYAYVNAEFRRTFIRIFQMRWHRA